MGDEARDPAAPALDLSDAGRHPDHTSLCISDDEDFPSVAKAVLSRYVGAMAEYAVLEILKVIQTDVSDLRRQTEQHTHLLNGLTAMFNVHGGY